jgi:hypothetical protein
LSRVHDEKFGKMIRGECAKGTQRWVVGDLYPVDLCLILVNRWSCNRLKWNTAEIKDRTLTDPFFDATGPETF